jgi:hypothetical protein
MPFKDIDTILSDAVEEPEVTKKRTEDRKKKKYQGFNAILTYLYYFS